MRPERLTVATPEELEALSALCLRSKAHWGYDAAFLDSRRAELTIGPGDLSDDIAVIRDGDDFTAVVHVKTDGVVATLDKLFIDPPRLGLGLGTAMMRWALTAAKLRGAEQMWIDAEPASVGFYARLGAQQSGWTPSEPPAGRRLPRLTLQLKRNPVA